MSTIKISELSPIGSDLFQDSESFLEELNDQDIEIVRGGVVVSQVTVSAEYSIVNSNLPISEAIIGAIESYPVNIGNLLDTLKNIFSMALIPGR